MPRVDAVLLGAAISLLAQPPPPVIREDVGLVLVSAIVTDHRGAVVNGLRPDNFTIVEDKVPQPILSFSTQDAPCSVGVILDLSGSMRDKLPAATAAVRAFFQTANPEDESFLLTVATHPESVSGFSADFEALQNSLLHARAGGSTALIDTVYLGLDQMRSARHPHKALLIVSDGIDNHSRYSSAELLRLVQETDVQIYTIGVPEDAAGRKPIELRERSNGLHFLRDLADNSGGLSFTVVTADDVAAAAQKIGRAVRSEYVLGYRQSNKADSGKWRNIQVKVRPSHLRVYARRGYYSP
ncbi:MAG: VWA domain-containing protein [Bryobacteraceae bacterium]